MPIMAAPLDAREAAMARALKRDFEKAAAGHQPGGAADGKKAERPESNHNLEPAIQDKKAGAILDKGADHTARHGRAPPARTMTHSGYDLSR